MEARTQEERLLSEGLDGLPHEELANGGVDLLQGGNDDHFAVESATRQSFDRLVSEEE